MVALEKERDQRIENCGIVLSQKEKPSQGNRLSLQAVPAKRENRGPYPILIVLSRKARRANLFWETAFSTGTNRGQFSELSGCPNRCPISRRRRPNQAKSPRPIPMQAIETIQPDCFRHVFKTVGFLSYSTGSLGLRSRWCRT